MSDKQPTPNIVVQYITQEAPKPKWSAAIVFIVLFFSIVACGQCSRWFG